SDRRLRISCNWVSWKVRPSTWPFMTRNCSSSCWMRTMSWALSAWATRMRPPLLLKVSPPSSPGGRLCACAAPAPRPRPSAQNAARLHFENRPNVNTSSPMLPAGQDGCFPCADKEQFWSKESARAFLGAPGALASSLHWMKWAFRGEGRFCLLDHSNRAAVLAPAGNVVTDGHRALLAEGLAGDALGIDAAADQVIDHDRGAAGAEGDIVFTGAALVGMAFDHDAVIAVLIE